MKVSVPPMAARVAEHKKQPLRETLTGVQWQ
jgi:hypothetical protein